MQDAKGHSGTSGHLPAPPVWRIPRLHPDDRIIAGVAGGVAEEVGISPTVIRAAMVVLATTGWGVMAYGMAWIGFGWRQSSPPMIPRVSKGATPLNRYAGVALVVLGLYLLFGTFTFGIVPQSVGWPVAMIGVGTLIAWHRGPSEPGEGRPLVSVLRVGVGLTAALGGLVLLITLNLGRRATLTAIGAVAVVALGLALVLGPWVWRTMVDLAEERRRRIRSEERAEVAAHLHDSVLQTLSLIQRQSGDPAAMVSLARRQERELRHWLFADDTRTSPGGTFCRSVAETAAEIEERFHVRIEVVTVGDLDMDDDNRLTAVVAAAREAMTNAARHSGAASIDVFAEVTPTKVELFVRDSGSGFDPAAVADDRRGIADSIRGRLRRAGGWATIDSAVGQGTEVTMGVERRMDP